MIDEWRMMTMMTDVGVLYEWERGVGCGAWKGMGRRHEV